MSVLGNIQRTNVFHRQDRSILGPCGSLLRTYNSCWMGIDNDDVLDPDDIYRPASTSRSQHVENDVMGRHSTLQGLNLVTFASMLTAERDNRMTEGNSGTTQGGGNCHGLRNAWQNVKRVFKSDDNRARIVRYITTSDLDEPISSGEEEEATDVEGKLQHETDRSASQEVKEQEVQENSDENDEEEQEEIWSEEVNQSNGVDTVRNNYQRCMANQVGPRRTRSQDGDDILYEYCEHKEGTSSDSSSSLPPWCDGNYCWEVDSPPSSLTDSLRETQYLQPECISSSSPRDETISEILLVSPSGRQSYFVLEELPGKEQ